MSQSFWARYKAAVNPKSDVKEIFFRSHDRYATLDGFRAITVLLMVMFHVLFGVVKLLEDNPENVQAFIESFPRALGWLWQSQGSDPLFMLCGLLVSYTLFREYEKTNTLQIGRFYKRRLMRIYPLFVIALILHIPADFIDNIQSLLTNLVFISNYVPDQRHILPVGWSLDVQLQFYFMLPFLILAMYATRHRLLFLIGLCLLAFAWRYYVVVRDPIIWQTPFYQIIYDGDFGSLLANELYYDIDVRIGCFFLGMLVAYLHHYHGETIQRFFSRHLILNGVLVIAGAAMVVVSLFLPIENKNSWLYENFNAELNFWFLVADRYLYSLGLSILVLLALCAVGLAHVVRWVLSWPVWHPFAQLIFPIYLFHFPLLILAAVVTFMTTDKDTITAVSTLQVFSLFFFTVLFTMIFAIITHIFVEKPFLTMREPDGVKDPSAVPNTVATGKA